MTDDITPDANASVPDVQPEPIQLAQGKSLEEVLGATKVVVTEISVGKYVANVDGVIFDFTIEDIVAASSPPECIKAKFEAARAQ